MTLISVDWLLAARLAIGLGVASPAVAHAINLALHPKRNRPISKCENGLREVINKKIIAGLFLRRWDRLIGVQSIAPPFEPLSLVSFRG